MEFGGWTAYAIGWGWTSTNSPFEKKSRTLQFVDLKVSRMRFRHFKMFGTTLTKNDQGFFKDACSGDSGSNFFLKIKKATVFGFKEVLWW